MPLGFNRRCAIDLSMTLAELPQVAALSVDEKIQLVNELWDSMADELNNSPVSDEEKQLLDDRWEHYQKHPETALTLEQCIALIDTHRAHIVQDQEKKLLDERWENYLACPESALTLEQFKALERARFP
ncbi:MAG: addiction module protein [Verrucomicrobiales bacterium]|nr:addiction module protein [Verrucomicrobiales bacterium]